MPDKLDLNTDIHEFLLTNNTTAARKVLAARTSTHSAVMYGGEKPMLYTTSQITVLDTVELLSIFAALHIQLIYLSIIYMSILGYEHR